MRGVDPGLRRTLLALTFVTGIVDAVTFLGLGQVFAAMQTGNVIFLGLGIAGSAGAPFLAPLIALAAFLAGGVAALALTRPGSRRALPRLGPALAVEVGLLGAAALVAASVEVEAGESSAYALIAVLGVAMGLRNTVVRGLGGANLATTVLNLTVAALTVQAPPSPASGADLGERAAALLALLAGAVAGALLIEISLPLPLAIAAAIALLAGLTQLRARRPAAT